MNIRRNSVCLKLIRDRAVSTGFCYCGTGRTYFVAEIVCVCCKVFYHVSCLRDYKFKLAPYLCNYIFLCRNCSSTGTEHFKMSHASNTQLCITAIANLQQHTEKNRKLFHVEREIIPFIEHNWNMMTIAPLRVTKSWHKTVTLALLKEVNLIFKQEINASGLFYGLMDENLSKIAPNYQAMLKNGYLKLTADGNDDDDVDDASTSKGGARRKAKFDTGATGKKGRPSSDVTGNVKLPPHGYPLEHPYNKDGYRYMLAEPDPHAPFRQEFDDSADWAGKPIPGWLYRTLVPTKALLALHDRAPQVKISEDRLSATGDKGYCTTRATHYVNRGRWYFEVTINAMPMLEGYRYPPAVRLGWGQKYANLQAPVGYDKFGYCWRSRKGTTFHGADGLHYSEGFGVGDTLGFYIELPEEEGVNYLPETYKDRPLVKFKSHLYYEDKDNVKEALKNLRVLKGSKIENFKNGVSCGVAYTDIYAGSYYPTISTYKASNITVNFGPNFKYPTLPLDKNAKGIYERAEDFIAEQFLADLFYLVENDGKLRLD